LTQTQIKVRENVAGAARIAEAAAFNTTGNEEENPFAYMKWDKGGSHKERKLIEAKFQLLVRQSHQRVGSVYVPLTYSR
jgi:hypothetical protein